MKCWTYDTAYGPFAIVPREDGYHIVHEGEALGRYDTPEAAAAALAAGHSNWPSFGDPRELHIPADLDRWHSRSLV